MRSTSPGHTAALLAVAFLTSLAPAQITGTATVPAIARDLPGNAAIAMPARWKQGVMQVLIEASLLPPELHGQSIRQIRLRRPAFLGEPAYPALTRTLKVSAAFTPLAALNVVGTLAPNRPTNLQVVAGPLAVTIPATPAGGPGTALGAPFVTIPLTAPLPVAPGNLFLEFETLDAPFGASPEHWVDAFWTNAGFDSGVAVTVGNGGCPVRPVPLALRWNAASTPTVGVNANLELTGAPGQSLVWAIVGLDPQTRPVGGAFLGFGASLAPFGLAGCFQWTPADGVVTGFTTQAGTFPFSLPLPATVVVPGQRIGVQMAVLDATANALGIATSNGVVLVANTIGLGPRCNTVLTQGTQATSPWPPYRGMMPVLLFDY